MGPTTSVMTAPRNDLIAANMPMAARIARTFAGRGTDLEDLTQVAMLELVRTVSRFDSARGVAFSQYAYPCIVGALKKHFRDTGWSLHITRRLQELHLQTRQALPELTQILGRTPTVADVAAHLGLSEKDARDGMSSRMAYNTKSLDAPSGDSADSNLGQVIGGVDRHLDEVPDRHAVAQNVATLSTRERAIVHLRFTQDLSQREIAEQLGISQMHVSRLLKSCLDQLRMSMVR